MNEASAQALGVPTGPRLHGWPSYESLQGLPRMMLFLNRRNWFRLSVWFVLLVGMLPLVYESQRAAFLT